MKNLKNQILKNSAKLTNISMGSLFSYASVYYLDKTKLLVQNPEINQFLDIMKDKALNSPDEVISAALTVGGSYLMGHKNPHVRLATFVMWSISNGLYANIAIQNNITPMLAQMAVFQLINFNAIKNIVKDELVPQYKENLSNEKIDISIKEKLSNLKDKAVINSAKRMENIYDKMKTGINGTINLIKENKGKSLLLLSSVISTALYNLNETFDLNDKMPLLMEGIQNAVTSSPIESIAALTALVGSYMLSKTGIDVKIKGVSLFLAADIMYMNIAHSHDMAPMLVQTAILIGGSLKALENLNDAKYKINNSEFKEEEKTILDKLKSFTEKFQKEDPNIDIKKEVVKITPEIN